MTYKQEAGLKAALEYDVDSYGCHLPKAKKAEDKSSDANRKAAVRTSKPARSNPLVSRKLPPVMTEENLKAAFKRCG